MTPAQKFSAWLADAMRNAGLDIDNQRGGGRLALANALDISRSTVTRWLSGQVIPGAEYFEPLADALGVPVLDMLTGSAIISPQRIQQRSAAPEPYDSGEEIPEHFDMKHFAALLGYFPEEQEIFVAVVETTMASLRERRIRALAQAAYEGDSTPAE